MISLLIFIKIDKLCFSVVKNMFLINILWINFMILCLKYNIIAGGNFDPPPSPQINRVIP